MKPASYLLYLLALAAAAQAQPVVASGGIVNAASYAHPGLPNGGVAQGSLFTIFGSGLGPSSSPSLAFPLVTTLGGVSVSVSQGATTVAAIPVYVGPGQINAIMPSTAPLGNDNVTVTYQGQTSAAATVQVVTSSFGIFSVNSLGGGQGILTNVANQLITYTSSAHPGDTLIIWGTGLGPITSSDANPPPVGNIAASNPVLYVGGVPVTPSYHGRSGCCSGLDQISFQLPPNVTGCSVPLSVQTGSTVSNFVSIAIAASGSQCSDPRLPTSLLSQFSANSSASIGSVIYEQYNFTSPGFSLLGGGNSVSSGAQQLASFTRIQFADVSAIAPILNAGACSVYTFNGATAGGAGIISTKGLNAGASISITGGGSAGQLQPLASTAGFYSARFALTSGTSYTFAGPGGSDVGAFSVTLPVSQQSLAWTNESAITAVQRGSGVNVTWTGADPSSTVQITGSSIGGSSTATAFGAGFTCTAPGSAGQFTVPSAILLSLPPSANLNSSLLNVSTGTLGISSISAPVPFTATGLDFGVAFDESIISNSTITYQ